MLARRRVPYGSLDDNFVNCTGSSPDPNHSDSFGTDRSMTDRVRPSSAKDYCGTSGRDRTFEFISVIKCTQAKDPRYKSTTSPIRLHSNNEFNIISGKIGKDMASSFEKLESLKLIVSKKQDAAGHEAANQLTDILRQDLGDLNKQIAQLQQFLRHQVFNKQRMAHSNSVIVALQSRLVKMSTEFKVVLEVKQQNMKNLSTANTPQQNITDVRKNSSGRLQTIYDNSNDNMRNAPASSQRQNYPTSGQFMHQNSYNLPHVDISPDERTPHYSQDYEQVAPSQSRQMLRQRYIQDQPRDDMVKIEQTIVELGGIFQQLTTMVHEQGEMVQRIDSNIDDTHLNIEEAHSELVKYFRSVASTRAFMLKVFAVLIVFVFFFLFFYL